MENQKKEDEARKKSIPELEEEERRFRVTEEREEIIQRGDGPAIVMRTRNTTVTTDVDENCKTYCIETWSVLLCQTTNEKTCICMGI